MARKIGTENHCGRCTSIPTGLVQIWVLHLKGFPCKRDNVVCKKTNFFKCKLKTLHFYTSGVPSLVAYPNKARTKGSTGHLT